MGYLAGKAAWVRFRVTGQSLTGLVFGQDHLDRLADHAAGRQKAAADGVEAGWGGGDSVLDRGFSAEKNVYGEFLTAELVVERDVLPGDLFRAYYKVELDALAKNNPSGLPSARQKREAKEAARGRLEDEAKDGRFRKRKATPFLWDQRTREVMFGTAAVGVVDRFQSLFEQTFDAKLEFQSAGRVAGRFADVDGPTFAPALPMADPNKPADVAWIADEAGRDHLGNEFLLWLLYTSAHGDDTFGHAAGEITVMSSGTLHLDCPRGQSGQDTFRHEMPVRLPEVRRALAAGKLPRKAGLTFVRHDRQFSLVLHAEHFACTAVAVPKGEGQTDERQLAEARLESVRDCAAALDDLMGLYLAVRQDAAGWAAYLAAVRGWLA